MRLICSVALLVGYLGSSGLLCAAAQREVRIRVTGLAWAAEICAVHGEIPLSPDVSAGDPDFHAHSWPFDNTEDCLLHFLPNIYAPYRASGYERDPRSDLALARSPWRYPTNRVNVYNTGFEREYVPEDYSGYIGITSRLTDSAGSLVVPKDVSSANVYPLNPQLGVMVATGPGSVWTLLRTDATVAGYDGVWQFKELVSYGRLTGRSRYLQWWKPGIGMVKVDNENIWLDRNRERVETYRAEIVSSTELINQ